MRGNSNYNLLNGNDRHMINVPQHPVYNPPDSLKSVGATFLAMVSLADPSGRSSSKTLRDLILAVALNNNTGNSLISINQLKCHSNNSSSSSRDSLQTILSNSTSLTMVSKGLGSSNSSKCLSSINLHLSPWEAMPLHHSCQSISSRMLFTVQDLLMLLRVIPLEVSLLNNNSNSLQTGVETTLNMVEVPVLNFTEIL